MCIVRKKNDYAETICLQAVNVLFSVFSRYKIDNVLREMLINSPTCRKNLQPIDYTSTNIKVARA